ncbi:Ribosome biogenesis protein NSA2 homolog [Aduncisulcus paluster]|uniref:Ribosome biogenesis protein NSA2 homolog n=1 Tax=Aduncisulcus paluster TaxID=2918883 RepID=A0ABQ5JXP3_9EUKA|nr:Ribosome biogenesis protein NSA2 homolog [Aduncisulcus paluster]GKT21549.1 Ribosome biogenesis protein NSA2 homolog [Aduncisulcus paluster]
MPQNEYVERHQKIHGYRYDHFEKKRKKLARAVHEQSKFSQKSFGIRAKLHNRKRRVEKIEMKKAINRLQEREAKGKKMPEAVPEGAIPAYLMDREGQSRSKVLSNMMKQKKKERTGKWHVPIQKVKPITQQEMFQIIRTGKRKKKQWKRMVTQPCFVGPGFVRKPPKYERFIRPAALRFKKAHVTHPELKTTFCLDIIKVVKNPSSQLFTTLGVLSKGSIIEVNVADLGLVTQSGKVVWGKYAQIMNNPDRDGCVNALLLV